MKILVIGATGTVGSAGVGQLQQRGAEVRVLTRKQRTAVQFPSSVDVAVGDLLDPDSVREALQGVEKLFS